jgi:hypothetical protein
MLNTHVCMQHFGTPVTSVILRSAGGTIFLWPSEHGHHHSRKRRNARCIFEDEQRCGTHTFGYVRSQ